MAEVQKPVTIPEPVAPEAAPAAPVATGIPALDNTTPAIPETKPEEVKTGVPEPTTAAALTTEEPKVDEVKPVEPISTGILGYKAPGLVKSLIFSKKTFWLGDEAVPANSLSSYLRGEKGDVAHPTVAWSSQTGKGLLYFVKHAEEKKNPAGVLNLAEATDLSKDGAVEFSLKLHAHKHAFQAKTSAERDGWFVAVEKAVEEAKASAETIRSSEGYKESLEKLNKPFGVVAGPATTKETTPKKSNDVKPVLDADRVSSSSSSSDEEKKEKKKSKSKSRSASRKRASIFGGLIGKKDEIKEKKEIKKEEHEEAKAVEKKDEVKPVEPESTLVAAQKDGATDAPVIAPVVPAETATTEPTTTAVAPVAEPVTETTDAKPKPTKRGSVFGSFFEKVRSPVTEKKESEVAPAVPPKDKEIVKDDTPAEVAPPVVAAAAPAPVITETAPVVDTKPEETKPEETKVDEPKVASTTPKEKKDFSFGKFFGAGNRSKSPAAAEKSVLKDDTPKVDETAPKIEEIPAVAPIAPIAPVEPVTDVKADETKPEETVTPTDAKEKRRSSFFGNLTSSVKKDKKTETEATEGSKDEKHPSKLSGLFRNPSKAVKSKKDKDTVVTKPEETTEVKDDKVVAPAVEEPKVETKPVEDAPPKVIGDVVPEAVTVGQAQPSTTPAVQASA